MKEFNEVLKIIAAQPFSLKVEKVDLLSALGRVLAEDVLADADLPPFSRSAMDGYACRKEDRGMNLRVIEDIPAGKVPVNKIERGTTSKIMTGAMIPEGADWIIRVEDTIVNEDGSISFTDQGRVSNIRYRGEDLTKGEVILEKGTLLSRQLIGNLASVGCINPPVYKKPLVGILNTGSEIIPASQVPGQSQIRNTNGPQLMAQLSYLGVEAIDYGIIEDDYAEIKNRILKGVSICNVFLISGGVSAGDYDFIPEILEEIGFEILVHKMKVRPGKPLLFARRKEIYVFGIPGNPVSSLVQFEVIIKNFLLGLMGSKRTDLKIKMPAGEDIGNKKTSLRIFLPVRFIDGEIFIVPYHGSGHLSAWALADGILEIPEDCDTILKGETAYVRPF